MEEFDTGNLENAYLSERLRRLVDAELADGERVRWLGQPIPRRFARRGLPIVLFAIPWTAFALFWMGGAAGFRMPKFQQGFDFFPLFGIPFVLIGCGMLSTPFWMLLKSRRTVYAITDRRAIIFEGGFGATTIQSFGPDQLNNLRRTQQDDGSGDVLFQRDFSNDNNGKGQPTDVGFFAVPDVKAVEALIRSIKVK